MSKLLKLLFLILLINGNVVAQKNSTNKLSKTDSLQLANELADLIDTSANASSYAAINVGIGNRLFSVNNNALNAKESTTGKVIYTPSIGYYHKSGLGLTAGANFLNDVAGFGINQYSLSPSYDLVGNESIAFSMSYTHYFVSNKYSLYSSPIQNDFFTSIAYKKYWLQPGIAVGYSMGEYGEAKSRDTVIGNNKRRLYDSVNNKLSSFSFIVTLGHQFLWNNIFSKKDDLNLSTTLMANAGSSTTTITHKTNAVALFDFLKKRGRIPKKLDNPFEMQSIGLNLNLNYTVGKFNFEPQLYLDYYVPNTDVNKFTTVFNFNVGYAF